MPFLLKPPIWYFVFLHWLYWAYKLSFTNAELSRSTFAPGTYTTFGAPLSGTLLHPTSAIASIPTIHRLFFMIGDSHPE
jgi:hypothetical protein